MARARSNAFPLYDVTVRLNGSRYNEVSKTGITAPEVMLLGAIHGPDSLASTKPSKSPARNCSDREERERLMRIYEGSASAKRGFISRVFGPSTVPLPRELDGGYSPQEQVSVAVAPPEIAEVIEDHAALVG